MSLMKNFITLQDLVDLKKTIALAKSCKQDPFAHAHLGQRKTIGLLFFNPSLRTRLSTQKAARNLGLDVMVMNFSNEAWAIEYENETIMSGLRSEHVKEAAQVVSQYCDFVAIRAFASLTDKKRDEEEQVLRKFAEFATIPIINMESATAHPSTSFGGWADHTGASNRKKAKNCIELGASSKGIAARGCQLIYRIDESHRSRLCHYPSRGL